MCGLRFGLVSSIQEKEQLCKNRSGVLNRFCMAGPLEGRQGQGRCQ